MVGATPRDLRFDQREVCTITKNRTRFHRPRRVAYTPSGVSFSSSFDCRDASIHQHQHTGFLGIFFRSIGRATKGASALPCCAHRFATFNGNAMKCIPNARRESGRNGALSS